MTAVKIMMKVISIFLIFSFFASTLIAAPPMLKIGNQDDVKEKENDSLWKYGSVNMRYNREMNREKTKEQIERGKGEKPSSLKMPTGAHSNFITQQEKLSLNSSVELISQRIQEAQLLKKQCENQLSQKIDIDQIKNEDLQQRIQEITANMEYWADQKKQIASLFENEPEEIKEDGLPNTNLFREFSRAANEAIDSASRVAEYYLAALDALGEKKVADSPAVTKSFFNLKNVLADQGISATENPLSGGYNQRNHEGADLKRTAFHIIKVPSLNGPLVASTREEILEEWDPKAEVRYNKESKKYLSNKVELRGFLDTIARSLARSLQERREHRDAIEMIALSYGVERASRFKKHFYVRTKTFFGSPLTPELIKIVAEHLCQEDKVRERETTKPRLTWNDWIERTFARLALIRSSRQNSYVTIPEDEGKL